MSYSELKLQWQKDGKDIPFETDIYVFPENTGTYALRATADNCSSTSLPITVRASTDNKLQDFLSIDNTNSKAIKEDTLFLCEDNSYTFRSNDYTNWYLDGKSIQNNNNFYTIKQSGIYYIQKPLSQNCFLESKPIYVSLSKKVSPLKIDPYEEYIYCDQKSIYINDENIRGNVKLNFSDAITGKSAYNFLNSRNFLFSWINQGKYIINYETESCTSEPQYYDNTGKKLHIRNDGKKIGGTKITLCPNASINVSINYYSNDEVKLFRNGALVLLKAAGLGESVYFNLSETGKYHFEVTSPYCTPVSKIVSDTVEIEVPESISTALTISGQDCKSGKLVVKEYAGCMYIWYKDNQIIPNQNSSTLALKLEPTASYRAVLQKGFCSVSTPAITLSNQITGVTTICQDAKFMLESKSKNAIISWKGPNGFTSGQPTISINSVQPQHEGWYILSTDNNGCTSKDSVFLSITKKPEVSFDFASPICLNQDLIVKFKASPGFYALKYNLIGAASTGKYISISTGNPLIKEKYVNLGKITPNGNAEFFNYQYFNCSFPLIIPPHTSVPESCDNAFEFTNLKKTYCYQEKTTLKFKLPNTISTGKKLKVILESYWQKYDLGFFSGDSVQVSIPGLNEPNLYFIIEDENAEFVAMSKEFNITGIKPNIYSLAGNIYTTGTVTQCEGYGTILKADITPDENQSLQWKKDGVTIENATGVEFYANGYGLYSVAFIQQGCAVESSPITIKEGELAKPRITSIIGSTVACNGFSVPLAENSSFPYTSFEWKRNGQIIEKKFDREAFEAKETGYYTLNAYQGLCKASSDSIFIEIGANLLNKILVYGNTSTGANKVTICDQTPARFYNSNYFLLDTPIGKSDITLGKKYGFSFQWKRDNKNIEGANSASYSSTEPGVYYFQLKQGECIVNSNKVEVIRQNAPHVRLLSTYNYGFLSAKDTIRVCKGIDISIYAYEQNDPMFSWNKELYKDGVLIKTYSAKDKTNTSSLFTIKESGKYSIKLYPENPKICIASSDTSTILFVDKPFNMPTDTFFTCSDSISLYAQSLPGSANTYQWSFKNKIISKDYHLKKAFEEGLYTAEIKQTNTCTVIKNTFVERRIKVSIMPGDKLPSSSVITLCEGRNIFLFSASSSGEDPGTHIIVEWYRNQQKLPDTAYTVNANLSGEYFIRAKYKDCEATSNIIKLEVAQIKNQISPLVDSLGICINGSVQLLEASKETGYTYEWFKDNVGIEESSSTLKATQPGTYKALIQSGDCSVITPKVNIYASNQLPTATISGDTTLNIGDTANLKLSFTSSPPFTYKLNNNQEGTSEKQTIIHPVKIQESTIFKLTSIKNACGEGTVSGEAKVNVIILGNEPLIGHKITIAPVPAETYCEIIFDLPVSQEVTYQLLDMKGQTLSEKNLGQITYKKQYLNLNHLAAGEYLIRMQVGKDFVTRKLIKF